MCSIIYRFGNEEVAKSYVIIQKCTAEILVFNLHTVSLCCMTLTPSLRFKVNINLNEQKLILRTVRN